MNEKKDNVKNDVVSSREQVENKNGKKDVHFCKDCKWYDKSTQRDFHRKVGKKNEKGKRTEIVEIRAVCENPKSSSYHHLVMAEYAKRQCLVWAKGVYEKPVQEKKHKEESVKNAAAKESFKKTPKQSLR